MDNYNDENTKICPLCGREIQGISINMPSGVHIFGYCATKIYSGMASLFSYQRHEFEEIS